MYKTLFPISIDSQFRLALVVASALFGLIGGAIGGIRLMYSKPIYLQHIPSFLYWIAVLSAVVGVSAFLSTRIMLLPAQLLRRTAWISFCAVALSLCFGVSCVVLGTLGDPFLIVAVAGASFGLLYWLLLRNVVFPTYIYRATRSVSAIWMIAGGIAVMIIMVTLYRLVLAESPFGTNEIVSGAMASTFGGAWIGAVAARVTSRIVE